MVDAKGRSMKCFTFFLMLPEAVKKSKKVSKESRLPICYDILTLNQRMPGDTYSRNSNSSNKRSAGTSCTSSNYQQNLNNNNTVETANWQGLYPTIRE
eukprot:g27485.t1